MAYIGREPQIGNFQVCDAISVVNAQAAYTMQVGSVNVIPESVNHMIVSLNGVIQKPGSSYTISSSTITFSSNLATGDSIDFIYLLGNVLDLGTPSDDTVTGAKIVDNAINSEHYTDASIDLAHLSADSVDGSKIVDNAINSEHYTDGSIDTAHIGADQITAAKIADNAVVTAGINADAVTGAKIADDAINSEHYTDGSIDTAHIADNQITLAKLAGGTDGNIISYDASGDPVAIATGSNGQVLTSTGAGSPPAFEALPGGGLAMADQYRITANRAGNGLFNSNWERADTLGAGFIGTGLTESSGLFSFPSTGIYVISAGSYMLGSNAFSFGGLQIQVTADNSSYVTATEAYVDATTHGIEKGVFVQYIFDCTNTTNDKFRLFGRATNGNCTYQGNTGLNETWINAIKIGET